MGVNGSRCREKSGRDNWPHAAFTLPRAQLDLPGLIEALQGGAAGRDGCVEEWAVGEATLESVFLQLARGGGM